MSYEIEMQFETTISMLYPELHPTLRHLEVLSKYLYMIQQISINTVARYLCGATEYGLLLETNIHILISLATLKKSLTLYFELLVLGVLNNTRKISIKSKT